MRGVVRAGPDLEALALISIELAMLEAGIDDPELLDEFRRAMPDR